MDKKIILILKSNNNKICFIPVLKFEDKDESKIINIINKEKDNLKHNKIILNNPKYTNFNNSIDIFYTNIYDFIKETDFYNNILLKLIDDNNINGEKLASKLCILLIGKNLDNQDIIFKFQELSIINGKLFETNIKEKIIDYSKYQLNRILYDDEMKNCLNNKINCKNNQQIFDIFNIKSQTSANTSIKAFSKLSKILDECKLRDIEVFTKIFIVDNYLFKNYNNKNNLYWNNRDFEYNMFSYLEYLNLKRLNNLIKKSKTPHIIGLVGHIECKYNEINILNQEAKVNIEKIAKKIYVLPNINQDSKIHITILENIKSPKKDEVNLYRLITNYFFNNDFDVYTLSKIIFQYLYTLNVFKKNNFSHNDNHFGNFLIGIYDDNFKNIKKIYIDNGKIFKCNTEYLGKFIDFDRSLFYVNNSDEYNILKNNLIKGGANVYYHYNKKDYIYADYFMFFRILNKELNEINKNKNNMIDNKKKEFDILFNFSNDINYQIRYINPYVKNINVYDLAITNESEEYIYNKFVAYIDKYIVNYEHDFFKQFMIDETEKNNICSNNKFLIFSNDDDNKNIPKQCLNTSMYID
jgi:hypothetical protein